MAKNSKGMNLGGMGAATAIGAAIGGVLGVLFAPRSGRSTRSLAAREGKKALASLEKAASAAAPSRKKGVPSASSKTKAKAKAPKKKSTRKSS